MSVFWSVILLLWLVWFNVVNLHGASEASVCNTSSHVDLVLINSDPKQRSFSLQWCKILPFTFLCVISTNFVQALSTSMTRRLVSEWTKIRKLTTLVREELTCCLLFLLLHTQFHLVTLFHGHIPHREVERTLPILKILIEMKEMIICLKWSHHEAYFCNNKYSLSVIN